MESVNRRMAAGAAWMVLFKLLERTIGFASVLVLARLLTPGDFGLVAMATSFIALIELFSAFGFDLALIRLPQAERRHFDSAWTLNLLLGIAVAAVMLLTAYPIADFYNEPRLPGAIAVLALGSIAFSLENIGVVEFRRQMDFAREFRFQLAKKVATFSITIPLAFALRSYWALIAGLLAGRIVATAWSYWVHPYRPRLSLAAARELVDFSKWVLANNLVHFLKERGTDFIIGRLAGRTALGLYSIGYEIANLPTSELVAPINRAVLPGYARLAGDESDMRNGFVNVVGIIALLAVPAGVGIAVTGSLACQVLLGDKWLGAIPVIQIVALHGVITALQTNVYSAFLAMNRPHLVTRVSTLYVCVLLPLSAWLTIRDGIVGAAWACLITSVIIAPINYTIVLRTLRLRLAVLVSACWRPIAAAAVMAAAVHVASSATADMPPLGALALLVALGAIVYATVVSLLWWIVGRPDGPERFILQRMQSLLGRPLTT